MTLIKSISGIRGTIGGKPGNNLSPEDIVKFASAYGFWLKTSLQPYFLSQINTEKVKSILDIDEIKRMVSGCISIV